MAPALLEGATYYARARCTTLLTTVVHYLLRSRSLHYATVVHYLLRSRSLHYATYYSGALAALHYFLQ